MSVNITSSDIALVKQANQKRLCMIQIYNRENKRVCSISGTLTAGGNDIDTSSDVRRTGTLTMSVDKIDIDKLVYLNMNYYIVIFCGIENNQTLEVTWYKQGKFIISSNGFNFDKTTRNLSISLSDMMLDFTGERKGTLHAYTALVKNQQKIQDVMVNLVSEMGGVSDYDIMPICPYRDSSQFWDENANEDDYNVPYDIEFSVGVTIYEVLKKLADLYPQWEIFFDVDGRFICQKEVLEDDDSPVMLDDTILRGLVISEDTTIDYSEVKNVIEVWGKDGLCYGEARDSTPDSPFNVNGIGELRRVMSGGDYDNIYDTYKGDYVLLTMADTSPSSCSEGDLYYNTSTLKIYTATGLNTWQTTGTTPQQNKVYVALDAEGGYRWNGTKMEKITSPSQYEAGKIKSSGNQMAEDWAKYLLYQTSRLHDKITLQLIFCPFINEANFKISYRSKVDNIERTYVVKKVSHSYDGNTTTLEAIRFYADNCPAYQSQLSKPVISSVSANGMILTVLVNEVPFATEYGLYMDNRFVVSSSGTTLNYTFAVTFEGEHTVFVVASADGFQSSEASDTVAVELVDGVFIITNSGGTLITNNNENIEINEGI